MNIKYQVLRIDLPPGSLKGQIIENKIFLDSSFKKCTGFAILTCNYILLFPVSTVRQSNDVYIDKIDSVLLDFLPEDKFMPFIFGLKGVKQYFFKCDFPINGNQINCKIQLNDDLVILPALGVVPYYFIFKLEK